MANKATTTGTSNRTRNAGATTAGKLPAAAKTTGGKSINASAGAATRMRGAAPGSRSRTG